VTIYSKK